MNSDLFYFLIIFAIIIAFLIWGHKTNKGDYVILEGGKCLPDGDGGFILDDTDDFNGFDGFSGGDTDGGGAPGDW
jgi:hypothetical protein